LHTSKARPHLNYIHEHFPLFPDPHTYIVTEVFFKIFFIYEFFIDFYIFLKSGISNEKEYQKTREIIAQQKINVEKALVKFKLKNDLNKFAAQDLSIFHETTDDTIFMGLFYFNTILNLKRLKLDL
jgi:hypothetical protein